MFAPSVNLDIPYTDVLSWTFGNTTYDLDKPLFVDADRPEKSISHNQAKTVVRKLIGGFKAIGLEAGDRVCLHSNNNIHYALIFLAVIGAGGIFVGSNPHYTVPELSHLFSISHVRFVIAQEEYEENVRQTVEELRIGTDNIFILASSSDDNRCSLRPWTDLLQHPESDWITFDDENLAKTTVTALMSTSGTTGHPKAAQTTHYTQVAQSVMLHEADKPYEVIRLLCLPQFHAFNAPLSLIAPIREGHRTYIMKKYEATKYLDHLRVFRPTETTMVNPMMYKLINIGESEWVALESLRAVWCAGVRLGAEFQTKFKAILHPDAIVKQAWGLTEIGWASTFKYPESGIAGSVGRLLPNTEARIIDNDGNDVCMEDVHGEVLLRSPSLTIGYWNNDAETASTIVNGWLHTGDVGYQNNGNFYLVDRLKDLIKVRGWQVSPSEIESCLLTHPAIIDVAIIGVDFGEQIGELPRAYVALHPHFAATTSEDEIKQYLVGRLSRYKALEGGVRVVSYLPRNSTGKILKNQLREEARAEILAAEMASGFKQESVVTEVELQLNTVPASREVEGVVTEAEIQSTLPRRASCWAISAENSTLGVMTEISAKNSDSADLLIKDEADQVLTK